MTKAYNIAVIPGDGTGPEVVAEGIKALDTAAAEYGFEMKYQYYDLGGERYMKTGEVLPDSVIRGERFGMICFGSRLDVYLPADASANVTRGDRVKAGQSIIGYLA